jgi:hypothetical protein
LVPQNFIQYPINCVNPKLIRQMNEHIQNVYFMVKYNHNLEISIPVFISIPGYELRQK